MMEEENKKHIDGLKKVKPDFTDQVMKTIQDEETTLSSIIVRNGTLEPSPDFASLVMSRVNTTGKYSYQPVISKRVWMLLAFIFTLVIAASVNSVGQSTGWAFSTQVFDYPIAFKPSQEIMVAIRYGLLTTFGISLLLLFEQQLNRFRLAQLPRN